MVRRLAYIAALSCVLAAPAWAGDLLSYEAVYELRLTHASSSGGPRAATGLYETRFAETCDGWDSKTHTVLNLAFGEGPSVTNERFFSSWEAKTGRDYQFAAFTLKNGKRVEAYTGTADLGKRGGQARYEVPAAEGNKIEHVTTLKLPQGTLFPAAHAQALLSSAEQGGPLFRQVVLNGSSSVGPRVMSTAIGPRRAPGHAEVAGIDQGLLGTPSWRMSSAYFNLFERRDMPNTEVDLQLYKSGVTESFEQTFGDFAVSAKLQRLRRLDAPSFARKASPPAS